MDINQIQYFLNLAETLNFTEAARQSGISQPSLTKSIQRLEDELGGPMVYRDGKDTRLTALGRDLQIEFVRVQGLLSNIAEMAENSVLGKQRRLAIGIASTIAPQIFARFWTHVMNQLPSVELLFQPFLPQDAEAEVQSGKFDMCILPYQPKPNAKLTILPLFEERLLLAMASSDPLAKQSEIMPEQMAEQPYFDRLKCEFRTQLITHFMDRNIVMRPRLQSDREDWIQAMVGLGGGVCALPERSAIVAGITLRPVVGLDLKREITLVAVSGSGNPREVRQIIDMAKRFVWK